MFIPDPSQTGLGTLLRYSR